MAARKSITTKKGDSGTTNRCAGETLPKDSLVVVACGEIDELMSILGVARCVSKDTSIAGRLLWIQQALFVCAAEVATPEDRRAQLKKRVDRGCVQDLEARCREIESATKMPSDFVVPGGSLQSAYIDYGRAVARRCERTIVSLSRSGELDNKSLLAWFNRVSDYLYLIARLCDCPPEARDAE